MSVVQVDRRENDYFENENIKRVSVASHMVKKGNKESKVYILCLSWYFCYFVKNIFGLIVEFRLKIS